MPDFEFKCGDCVVLKTALHHNPDPTPLIVLERWTQECPGGIQRHYALRMFQTADGATHCSELRVLDIEVCAPPSAEEVQKRVEAIRAENRKNRKAQWGEE